MPMCKSIAGAFRVGGRPGFKSQEDEAEFRRLGREIDPAVTALVARSRLPGRGARFCRFPVEVAREPAADLRRLNLPP